MTQTPPSILYSGTRPYILRGKTRKYLYEHICFCCEHPFLSTMKRMIYFCPSCLKDMKRAHAALQVKHNLHRAEKANLPATLTVKQWLATLDDFSWMCAYCLVQPYVMLEHFIPMNLGGGTSADNVLPSCRSCNSIKLFHHPVDIFPVDVIERVTAYLQNKVVEVAL